MRGQHQQIGLPSVCCVLLPPLAPCQRRDDTNEKNIWPPQSPSNRGSSLRFRSQAHFVYSFKLFLKWPAQLGFPFILLYYFQIKLALMSYSRAMKAKLWGIRVISHSLVQNSWALHLGQGVVDNPWPKDEVWWWQRDKRGDPAGLPLGGFQNGVKIPPSSTSWVHHRCPSSTLLSFTASAASDAL